MSVRSRIRTHLWNRTTPTSATRAIVPSRKEREEEEEKMTFDDHVSSADEVEIVPRQELTDDRLAEAIADAALVVFPVERCVARVTPQEVVQQAVIGHVGRARYPADVVHRLEARREAAVDAKNLGRDDGGDREAVEHVDERLPDLDVAPPFALVVETVHWSHEPGRSSQSSRFKKER